MNNQDEKNKLRRAVEARLALGLTARKPTSPCPDAGELACWHEGGIKGRRAREIQSHLGQCQTCYELWALLVEAEPLLPDLEIVNKVEPVQPKQPFISAWLSWLGRTWFGMPRKLLYTGGLGAALASVLLFFLILPTFIHPPSSRIIKQGYQALSSLDANAIMEHWPLDPKEDFSTKSIFSQPNNKLATDPVAIAFSRGVRSGIKTLMPDSQYWREQLSFLPTDSRSAGFKRKRKETLEELGRWAVLIYAACEHQAGSSLPPQFWTAQLSVLKQFDDAIGSWQADNENSNLLQRMMDISDFIETWAADTAKAKNESADERICGRADALLRVGLHDH